jgi:Pyridoxamine 5'-phosphate oxidase
LPSHHARRGASLLDSGPLHTGKLATVRADGRPRVAPAWFVLDPDGSVLIATGQRFNPHSTSLWDDLTQVWKVIDTGDLGGWGVAAYNGGLFTRDPEKNASGAATYALDLGNDQIGPALRGLLLDVTDDGQLGPVDFRSLSVREFGTIYEGLLESGLGVAGTDLAIDEKDCSPPEPRRPRLKPCSISGWRTCRWDLRTSSSRRSTGSRRGSPRSCPRTRLRLLSSFGVLPVCSRSRTRRCRWCTAGG